MSRSPPRSRSLRASLLRALRALTRVSAREHALAIEALGRLAVARTSIAVVPFPRIARRIGGFVAADAVRTRSAAPPTFDDQEQARAVARALRRAVRYAPFTAVCLPQALAARAMLHARGVGGVIHFGTMTVAGQGLIGHAWLDAAGVEVTGYPVDDLLTEVACLG